MRTTLLLGSLCVALFTSACAPVRAVPLAALPLATPPPVDPALRSPRRFAVCRFSDERGAAFSSTHPTSHVPIVHLFHRGVTLEYPDHAGAIRHELDGQAGVAIGGLDEALPELLARTMRQSGAAQATTVCGAAPDDAAPDYLILGRLRSARFRTDESVLLGATLGIFGVPFVFTRLELEIELTLVAAAEPDRPLWQRIFRAADRRAGGMYYGKVSVQTSLTRALERTLPEAARDVAAATFAHEARARR